MVKRNNIKTVEIKNIKTWEKFNLAQKYESYFQSFYWGEVQKNVGIPLIRFGFYKNSKLIALAQIFEIKAKRGHYLHIRQGPVFLNFDNIELSEIFKLIKVEAKKRQASFIRISPLVSEDNECISSFANAGFRSSPIHNIDAENRWVLNLDNSLDQIFSEMRKTTRYMIRRAEKEGIKIVKSTDIKDLDKFLLIYEETAKLKNFIPHSHIKEEFQEFAKNDKAFLYFGIQNNKVLNGAIIIHYGKEAIYRHGATSYDGRRTSASYLLQWEAIKDAKRTGLKRYNFWGIAKTEDRNNPWFGLSQFKMGFGGQRHDYVHSMDLPLKKSYFVSYIIDRLTTIKKGY